jgi:glycosyltransferase involved in cell wall biosynthesis
MSTDTVSVCIPSIPTRSHLLTSRALPSVFTQTHPVSEIAVSFDLKKEGAWENRNNAIKMANSEWIAFLDDDDEFQPHHVGTLLNAAHEHQADVVWGWFEVIGGSDPFPMHRGRQWSIDTPHIFPITCLVRRSLILDSNATFMSDNQNIGSWENQDCPFWKSIHDAGGNFLAIPDTTWNWYHHESNTSGLPNRW